MIITCENCAKTFNIQDKLIPDEGRLLQCGSCNHKWFFKIDKLNITPEKQENNITSKKTNNKNLQESSIIETNDINPKTDDETKEETIVKKKNIKSNKKSKYLKNLTVVIISIIALIILADTFKYQLNNYIPGINSLLNNLYETLKDIFLFFNDLIN
tara:strand:+ start:2628 stop:3098 length:471 start_codon:yes stop_codon:yes gene_type:complete